MKSLRNSNPISRGRLEEIAWWIETDIKGMGDQEAYDFLVGKCELMYLEILKVIAGRHSSIYLELNSYCLAQLEQGKGAICALNIELAVSYPCEKMSLK